MNMIEKVSRALAESDGENPDNTWLFYEKKAKAAIEAMRDPTTRMKAAGQWFQFEDPRFGTPPVNDCVKAGLNASRIWQEMVDASLSEESP